MDRVNVERDVEGGENSDSINRAGRRGDKNCKQVSTAEQHRVDARSSPSLSERIRERLERISGSKLTKDGVIVITANRFRTQEANREDAVARLVEMIAEAAHQPKFRAPSKPSRSAKKKRLDEKVKRGSIQKLRSARPAYH